MTTKELGAILTTCRFKAGMTQGQLAQRLHCDRTYISKCETGENDPRSTFTKSWVDVTGCREYYYSLFLSDEERKHFLSALDKLGQIEEILQPIA